MCFVEIYCITACANMNVLYVTFIFAHAVCSTSRLSKVIVWQTYTDTYRHAYIHTDRQTRQNYIPRRFADGRLCAIARFCYVFSWQHESLNADRVSRLLDAILANSPKDGFAGFCAALDSSEEGASYAMLAQELQHNLRLERGEIKPQQEFLDEATSLVHRLESMPFTNMRHRLIIYTYST